MAEDQTALEQQVADLNEQVKSLTEQRAKAKAPLVSRPEPVRVAA